MPYFQKYEAIHTKSVFIKCCVTSLFLHNAVNVVKIAELLANVLQ